MKVQVFEPGGLHGKVLPYNFHTSVALYSFRAFVVLGNTKSGNYCEFCHVPKFSSRIYARNQDGLAPYAPYGRRGLVLNAIEVMRGGKNNQYGV